MVDGVDGVGTGEEPGTVVARITSNEVRVDTLKLRHTCDYLLLPVIT